MDASGKSTINRCCKHIDNKLEVVPAGDDCRGDGRERRVGVVVEIGLKLSWG